MPLTDCHSHLHLLSEKVDLKTVIADAVAGNVTKIVNCSTDLDDLFPTVKIGQENEGIVFPCIGLHPIQPPYRGVNLKDANEFFEKIKDIDFDMVFGIGEVGLDFSRRLELTTEDKDEQREVLRRMVGLAKEKSLMVNVHARSAGHHAITLLKEEGCGKAESIPVLMHCFDGRAKHARAVTSDPDSLFFFSIASSACRHPQTQKLIEVVPLNRLVLETDSPFLAPVDGDVNTPKNVDVAAKEIARIKGVSVEEVERATDENVRILFPKMFED